MRRFSSYGPVNAKAHFCVERRDLIDSCVEHMLGHEGEEHGHFFTIWAPRQSGKTWLMRQAIEEIRQLKGDEAIVAAMSMQATAMKPEDPAEAFLSRVPLLMLETFGFKDLDPPESWSAFAGMFTVDAGLFDKPVYLFIDEFDTLPRGVIDELVRHFRQMYLSYDRYHLEGLALIGVRAVLGIESQRGSPFNVQRSVHVPNFTPKETAELFGQYHEESGQVVEVEVINEVHNVTVGQPGLVCWFGELLTEAEKYNPGKDKPIDLEVWETAYLNAMRAEFNNTVLNLVKKSKGDYQGHVMRLFGRADIEFSLDADWCNFLYMNGIIASAPATGESGEKTLVCRFSSPFVQERLYNALTYELIGDEMPILPLEPLDDLADVFAEGELNPAALLDRYKSYLTRLRAKGIHPWKDQPTRSDLRYTEAVGHFHLYAWIQTALIGYGVVISPEFPTGNGKVDLHLKWGEKRGIIEVKSFLNLAQVRQARVQAAGYAKMLGLDEVTVALFVPDVDEEVARKISGVESTDGVNVTVVAIPWRPHVA